MRRRRETRGRRFGFRRGRWRLRIVRLPERPAIHFGRLCFVAGEPDVFRDHRPAGTRPAVSRFTMRPDQEHHGLRHFHSERQAKNQNRLGALFGRDRQLHDRPGVGRRRNLRGDLMTKLLVDAFGDLLATCDGDLIACEPTAPTRLCCLTLVGGGSYQVIAPCGDLTATIAGVGNTAGCFNCDTAFNKAWPLPQSGPCIWSDYIEDVDATPNPGCLGDVASSVELRICWWTTWLILYLETNITFAGFGHFASFRELERTAAGTCNTFDWSEPDEILTCSDTITECFGTTGFCAGTLCGFNAGGVTVTIEAAT